MENDNGVSARLAFRRIGGDFQLRIDGFADLPGVLELDEAFWALNSIDIDTLRLDRRFLEFVDSDHNGKIRTDEVREAVRFVLAALRDGTGVDARCAALRLDAINPDSPDGPKILDAARVVLENIGRAEAEEISLPELQSEKEIRASAFHNGDGIIVPDPAHEEAFNARIQAIVATAGSRPDLSGTAGVGTDEIDAFTAGARAFLDWLDRVDSGEENLRPFGADSGAVYALYMQLRDPIDAYFLNSDALDFFDGDPERVGRKAFAADVRAPAEVRTVLENVTLAEPRRDRMLDLGGALNPLFAERLRKLFAFPGCAAFLAGERLLERERWNDFKAALADFGAWQTAAPEKNEIYARFDPAELRAMLDDPVMTELRAACSEDLSAGAALGGLDTLHKLLLYQRNLLELLNNFVSLSSLFSLTRPAPIQAGKLVMDGRHYTLGVPVRDVAEHKRIVELSDICVLYIELSSSNPTVPAPFKTVAVAVTAGSMRNLFVGKRGIFFDTDGALFDAKVTAFVEQPVSVSEALKEPFRRLGAFFGGQVNKFFSARSSGVQKSLGDRISTGKVSEPPKPAAGSGSMLLMGGSIGLAAIGSSVAFIAKSLENVSLWTVFSVIAGILLICGGPMVVGSLIKLCRRNLSRFFEACGCAVNRPMRLSRRMGLIFSFTPRMPEAQFLRGDLVNLWNARLGRRRKWFVMLLLVLLTLLLAALAGARFSKYYLARAELGVPAKRAVRAGKKPMPDRKKLPVENNPQEKKR